MICSQNTAAFLEISSELLRAGNSLRFCASGSSMGRTIRNGEIITVAPVSAHAIRRGDILLYNAGRGLTAHRVRRVEKREDNELIFHLRGDACASFDAPAQAAQILGRVVAVERAGRQTRLVGRRAALSYAAFATASRLKALVRAAGYRRGWPVRSENS